LDSVIPVTKEEKVICQLCKREVCGKRIDSLPVAKEHNLPSGLYCEGSRAFALPISRMASVRRYSHIVHTISENRLPAVGVYGLPSSVFHKVFGCFAMLFK
jgi:hypothetical protein